MLIRSLTFAILLAAGPAMADGDAPLAQDRGQARPLIVIAPSTVDKTLVDLKKSLDEPANHQAFVDRNIVLYTVVNLIGQRNGKDMDAQTTMALIRQLGLGAGAGTRVILVGKDGEKKMEKTVKPGDDFDPKELFATIDQLPPQEKEAAPPAPPPTPAAEAKPGKVGKNGKPVKPSKPVEPPIQPDD
ncbi:MAG: DUF4174 domain-containing protein [Pseudomonas sp.]